MAQNKLGEFYTKLKMQINNYTLYPLGLTNTIIVIVEMKKKEKEHGPNLFEKEKE